MMNKVRGKMHETRSQDLKGSLKGRTERVCLKTCKQYLIFSRRQHWEEIWKAISHRSLSTCGCTIQGHWACFSCKILARWGNKPIPTNWSDDKGHSAFQFLGPPVILKFRCLSLFQQRHCSGRNMKYEIPSQHIMPECWGKVNKACVVPPWVTYKYLQCC